VLELLDDSDRRTEELTALHGKVAALDGPGLTKLMKDTAELYDVLGRAQSYAGLRFYTDSNDEEKGALMQLVQERSAAISTKLLFFELEWAALEDDKAEELLAYPDLDFARHYLRSIRRYKDYLLSEPEERILTEKSVTGGSAWNRLFGELTSDIDVEIDGKEMPLSEGLALLSSADRAERKNAADAVTAGLKPGLKTRAFIYNTLLQDKSISDRLRGYKTWLSSRNLSNEASDESVDALIEAVRKRSDIPQRWYALKARLLGLDRLADYDRAATLADDDVLVEWDEATEIVIDGYRSFSPELADLCTQFFDGWIDAPVRAGKRPGAFCSYTVPSLHPYIMLNYTSRRRDVLTLAHELGHGVHAALARPQGIYHQGTPLTVAETASVFGETVVFGRLLDMTSDPNDRLSLLAENIEGAIATVFRQVAMNRFEDMAHTERRTKGELSVDRFGELWAESQFEMLGDTIELTEGYRSWWSYVPHFIGTPGYVYAYAYGQLLALSVYRRYEEQGPDFVPSYIEMLSAGGSMPPEDLGKIVDCDLADPGFWDGGLAIVEKQLEAAEAAAHESGRLS
jgi:oligoendopeptidase F